MTHLKHIPGFSQHFRNMSRPKELGIFPLFYTKLGKNIKQDKGALTWYGKLTWKSAHAWILIIVCILNVLGMTFIFMVHLSFYAVPLLIYDIMFDITTIP